MSFMFEVFYHSPPDARKEADLTARLATFGGQLTFREEPPEHGPSVCLTYEFANLALAEAAAEVLRQAGEHVEGPVDYA